MAKLAIVGDVHGKFSQMYKKVAEASTASDPIASIIQLGDLHTIRDEKDLHRFPAKEKHRKLGDYHQFHNAGKVPLATHFIGGNHDNYAWLGRHPEGFELIQGLHYLGRSGFTTIQGVNIGWVSGNFSPAAYEGSSKKKKQGHITKEDVELLKDVKGLDMLLLHDWPSLRAFESNIDYETISHPLVFREALKQGWGSDPISELIQRIQPRYVFAGHLHYPLTLDIDHGDAITTFAGLDQLERPRDLCIYDTETKTIEFLEDEGLFSVLTPEEKEIFSYGLAALETDSLQSSADLFDQLLTGEFSDFAKGFGHYGRGVACLKESQRLAPKRSYAQITDAINHFEKAIVLAEHVDTQLLLADALRAKIGYHMIHEKASTPKDKQMIELNKKIIGCYERASELNPYLASRLRSSIQRAELEIDGLSERIGSRN